ncbi:MAG: SH3 domain-containing protein [Haliscomenobacter sp.]|nr:SH3 domain-containing protein [Haliscomenobacter sp.]
MATPITPAAIEEGSTPLLASKIAAQKNLNVRSTPSVDGAKLGLIPQFDQVTLVERGPKDFVDGKEDYWYKVEYNGNYGYVFGHYTNFKLEGLRTITLPFMDCSMGDLYHIVFVLAIRVIRGILILATE